jgi:hypothetical protein
MTLNRVWMPSPNHSSRGGAAVRLIVVHTAEGSRTIESLGNFFASSSAGVSSHAGADDKENTIGEYVTRADKAWTQGDANPIAVALELCAFAAWDIAEWHNHPDMLANCAAWIAEEAAAFDIPIRALTPGEAQGSGRGVCQHKDLGVWGGNHSDCGPAFPMTEVLAMAAGTGQPPPATTRKGHNMIASTATGAGYWCATSDGAVYAFGDAQFRGNAFGDVTGEILGIAGKGNDGYWLFASDGGIFSFGSAPFYGRPDRA